MRIAFLTPEFPLEDPDEGGLATYINRMVRLLIDSGHEPEVFVSSREGSDTITYNGVRLHRVHFKRNSPVLDLVSAGSTGATQVKVWRQLLHSPRSMKRVLHAKALAAALECRHAAAPFRLVQSADILATGLFVRRRPDRVHVVRCSCAADLYGKFGQKSGRLLELCRGYLERLAMRRADVAYAPSRYLAEYFQRVHHIKVRVVRPPIYSEFTSLQNPSIALPARFFLHFGQFNERKGTALLAAALPIAWKTAPDLTMVWSGHCKDERDLERWRSLWGERADQVHITGPLKRPEVYAVLRQADAAILPSQVDNLPNTVIESLMLGVPVVGSLGASIDELVEDGRTGHLVALGDVHGLANAVARMWLKETPVSKGFDWRSELTAEMQPERAVANLIALANAETRAA
jgi:glycosyltransferase involved in cell wall biosynthesis